MRTIRFLLVQLPAPARDAASVAMREGFSGSEIFEIDTMEKALLVKESNCLELLVVGPSTSSNVARAMQAVNRNGMPRWAIVHLGTNTYEQVETVPPEDWNPRLLTRVFNSALLQHKLRGENQRLRGDLKTVARRFRHDLTTPVACIDTSASVLKIVPPGDVQAITTLMQSIEVSTTEISELTERVCFVLKASTDPIVITTVKMDEIVGLTLKQLDNQHRDIGATVESPQSWPEARGVAEWLRVIWWNLLSNALKHGGPAVQIRLDWEPCENGRRFCIYDNGVGVKPEIQATLFRPFDQLHTLHTAGLGLSIVQRLVSLQGGQCGYEHNRERGNCFYFTLPN